MGYIEEIKCLLEDFDETCDHIEHPSGPLWDLLEAAEITTHQNWQDVLSQVADPTSFSLLWKQDKHAALQVLVAESHRQAIGEMLSCLP